MRSVRHSEYETERVPMMPRDRETDEVLREELSPGEGLFWSGRPRQGLALRFSGAYVIRSRDRRLRRGGDDDGSTVRRCSGAPDEAEA